MSSILKLVVPCRVVRQVHQNLFSSIPKLLCPVPTRAPCISVRTMAQKSITSFFKVTPPKPVVKEEHIKVDGDDNVDSLVKTGKVKVR